VKALLLTHHFVYNYGANLQAFATCRALQSRGVEVEVINWRATDLEAYFRSRVPVEQSTMHEEFVATRLPLSPIFRTTEDIREYYAKACHRPDVVIVGSDTVLYIERPPSGAMSHAKYGNPFWLTWVDESPELRDVPTAYLSVSNTGSLYFLLEKRVRRAIHTSINRRCLVSVRDQWTRWMMRTLGRPSVPIEDGYDPVLSLNRHFDTTCVDLQHLNLPARYVLFNAPRERCSSQWVDEFREIVRKGGAELLSLPNPQGTPHWPQLRAVFPLSPLEWYTVIKRSAGYVGYRFHPVIVAMANQVPFVAVDTYGVSPLCFMGGNFPSKTFDVCRKAGRRELVIKSRFFPMYSPRHIYRKLSEQDADTSTFVTRAQSVFEMHLDRIMALVNRGQAL
jgi:hypothetical protein